MDPDAPELPSLEDLLRKPEWMSRATCAGMGTRPFFHGRGGDRGDAAKAVCAGCPVREECLAFALADPLILGIWGGTGAAERAKMRGAAANGAVA